MKVSKAWQSWARVKDLPGGTWHSGYMRSFRDDPLGLLVACARQGDAVSFRFGLSRVMLVSHPGLIEEVLVAHAQNFRKSEGTRRLRSLLGDGLLTSDGETWRRQRRLAQPAFHRARVEAYARRMVEQAVSTFDSWRDGDVRDVHQEMMELTLQIACATPVHRHHLRPGRGQPAAGHARSARTITSGTRPSGPAAGGGHAHAAQGIRMTVTRVQSGRAAGTPSHPPRPG